MCGWRARRVLHNEAGRRYGDRRRAAKMDGMALVPNFTPHDVAQNYDARSFSRARVLVPWASVEETRWAEQRLIVSGKVRGTDLYSTEVTAQPLESGIVIRSECSCPVGVACKHGAALALRLLQDNGVPRAGDAPAAGETAQGTAGGPPAPLQFPHREGAEHTDVEDLLHRLGINESQVFRGSQLPGSGLPGSDLSGGSGRRTPPGMPGGLPDWEQQLNEISAELLRAHVVPEHSPLALRFSVEPGRASRWNPDPTPLLHILPMKMGKRGTWIKSGASWTALTQPWNEPKFVPAQFAALSRLAEALRAQGSDPVSTYQLSEATPHLWRALEEAQEAGVEFLGEGMATAVQLAEEPVDVTLGVDASGTDATVMLGVAWDGYTCAGAALTPIGRRAFAVALLPSEATGDQLVLARLRAPLSERLTTVLGYGHQITVPERDRDKLAREVLPRVAANLPVSSDDPDFSPAAPEPPELVAIVDWDAQNRATVDFRFRYTQGQEKFDIFMEPSFLSHRVARNPVQEAEALRGWEHGPVTRELVEFTSGRPDSSVTYSASDSIRVILELIPELRTQMLVEVTERVPDLRTLDGDPEISFDVVGSGEDPYVARRRPARRPTADAEGKEESVAAEDGEIDWLDLRVIIRVDGHEIALPDVLAALTRHDEVMVVDGNVLIRLDHPAFDRLRRLVEDAESTGLTAKHEGTMRVGTADAALIKEAEQLGALPAALQRWAKAQAPLLGDEPPAHVEAVGVRTPLRAYQQDGLNWMHHLYNHGLGGILADDMGLGKTLQTLALIATLKGHRRRGHFDGPFLVVAPTSVVPTWKEQAAQHTPGLHVETITATAKKRGTSIADVAVGADLVVTSYALIRSEADDYAELAWKGLILDESQAIKNPASKTFHAVRRICTDFALAVTGTPFENRLAELWPPLSIAAPGLYPTLEGFRANVARPVEKEGNQEALQRLRTRIAPYMLRRSKSLVAQDLPEKQEEVLTVALEKSHRRFYDTLLQRERQAVLGLVDDFESNRVAIFAALTRMRMAALHASLGGAEEDLPSAKLTELIERLRELADEGHRALVFSQFVKFLKIIRNQLEAAGLECVYLDGSTQDRGRVLRAFREGKAPVFLISLKAGGSGITLTEADYVFIMDPWWNPAVEAQAVDRTHRIGQTKQVMVYRMVSEGTIEEKVMELKSRKAELFNTVIGDGSSSDATGFLDQNDIRGLLE